MRITWIPNVGANLRFSALFFVECEGHSSQLDREVVAPRQTRSQALGMINGAMSRRALLAGAACTWPSHLGAQLVGGTPRKRFVEANGLRMAYVESGAGAPIVFLHGNPTSSYLWRNVIPHVQHLGRCIAPDLLGMGDSARLEGSADGAYSFQRHCEQLDALLDRLGVDNDVTFVLHDWGGPLGFDWARRNPERIRALAFMETFVVTQDDTNTPAQALEFFTRFRTPEYERLVLQENYFVEHVFLRQFPQMSAVDLAEYRRPFMAPGESRRPTLDWPRQVPINGAPEEVNAAFVAFLDWIADAPAPKLFIRGEPGGLIRGGREEICRAWRNVVERTVPGNHYLPEHSPDAIGTHLSQFLTSLA